MTGHPTDGIDALAPRPFTGDAVAAVARITALSKTSFGPGMRILSRPRREGMWALYAFSRIIDDIADEDWPLAEKHRLLSDWRAEIANLYSGHPVSAIGRALLGPIRRYGLPKAEFLALIEGMEMDANGPIVAPSMAGLRGYTRRVAGSVGLLSMRIFGAWRDGLAERYALSLADAFQLTNILRDVEEDAASGRLYIPAELLDRHGLPHEASVLAAHPALPAVRADLGRLARAEFDAARAAMAGLPRLALSPALVMAGVYESYLNRLAAQDWRPATRVRLSPAAKLSAGLCCLFWPGGLRRDHA
ncbi:MAG: squalene/phytoene synthase family protein [Pseudomonadota bacterium]